MSKRPTFLQAFLISISGAALAFFGCLGFLSGVGRSSSDVGAAIGGIAFAAGILVLLGGLVLLAWVIIRAIINAARGPVPPPSDAGYPPSTRYGGSSGESNDPPA